MREALCWAWSVLLCLSSTGCVRWHRTTVTGGPAQARPTPASRDTWSDPRSTSTEAVIYRTWRQYLESKHGQFAANAGTPSELWVAAEQAKWPMYDLAGLYIPDGAVPQVLSIQPADSSRNPEYAIAPRSSSPDSAAAGSASKPVLTMSVYAVQEGNRWLLANALPRKTRVWFRQTVGQITYYVEPGRQFEPV